jgi:hypothetical protein
MRPISLVSVVLAGCAPPAAPTVSTAVGPSTSACSQVTIDPAAGGGVGLGGVTLTFPAGSIAATTDVEVCAVAAPTGFSPISDVVDVQPADLALLLPITATITHDGSPGAAAYAPDAAGVHVRQLRATDDGAAITTTLYRLGTLFAAADPRGRDDGETNGAADVLFVIDNSCSMADNQAKLALDMQPPLAALLASGLDYHLGVTTTDIDGHYVGANGTLRTTTTGLQWIDPATPYPEDVFKELAEVGEAGSGNEKGLGAAYDALEGQRETANAGFRRDDAQLAVVIFSDEPDLTPAPIITVDEFEDWFETLARPEASWFHTVGDPKYARKYVSVTSSVGGVLESIFASRYTSTLTEIVDALLEPVIPVIGAVSDPAKIEVWVLPADGAEQRLLDPSEWTFIDDGTRSEIVVNAGVTAAGDQLVALY